jgi:hypothetical protein
MGHLSRQSSVYPQSKGRHSPAPAPGYPVISAAKQIFDSSPIWTLHRQGDTTAIKIFDHYDGQKRILLLGPDICTADLYFPELIVIEVDSSLSENL